MLGSVVSPENVEALKKRLDGTVYISTTSHWRIPEGLQGFGL
jgi:hypothetical protein